MLTPINNSNSFVNFRLKGLTSIKPDFKSVANIRTEQDHTFIFIESNVDSRIPKGIYTISNSQSSLYFTKDAKSSKYFLSIPITFFGVFSNSAKSYFEFENDTEKQDNKFYIKNIDRIIIIPSTDSKDTQPMSSQEYSNTWSLVKYQKDKYLICKTDSICLSNVKGTYTISESSFNLNSINNFVFDFKITEINRLDTCNYVAIKSSNLDDHCLKFNEYDQEKLSFMKCRPNDQSFAWKISELTEGKKNISR